MKLTIRQLDWLANVIATAQREGWTKDEFVESVSLGWSAVESALCSYCKQIVDEPCSYPDKKFCSNARRAREHQ